MFSGSFENSCSEFFIECLYIGADLSTTAIDSNASGSNAKRTKILDESNANHNHEANIAELCSTCLQLGLVQQVWEPIGKLLV